ncbi:MAG: transposase [Hormoscilla sp. GM7CHS1pb]|nr:transposase [Hormoscilla sp. GM7CHS1pb]
MAPRKLLDSEKIDIIALYRETADTTSTLASRYNVSNSTISRLLKSRLPADEYELLVQQKRAVAKGQPPKPQPTLESAEEVMAQPEASIAPSLPESQSPPSQIVQTEIPLQITPIASPESEVDATIEVIGDDSYQAQVSTIEELLGEELLLEDQDDDEDDEDYSEDEEESSPDRRLFAKQSLNLAGLGKKSQTLIQILPLSEAELPKICYVVIDKAAELITRPLNDFSELGKIPPAENGSATLPIFENHRVARRFSKRSHRVIKVPDGSMLQKVSSYLLAKGISRLLIDGQVYSL